jgi:FtsH-binding integral membrane protein
VRHQSGINVLAFAAYALFTGFVVSGLVYVALLMGSMHGDSSQYVVQAFGLTALTFGGLTAYAFVSKRDFSFLRGMLTVGVFAILGLLILEFFIESSILALGTSFLAVLVFGGFTLYDTQKIVRTYPANEHIAGAVTLFTNFVLLFMHILRILLILASGRE